MKPRKIVPDVAPTLVEAWSPAPPYCGARAAQRPSSREQGLKAALGHARQSVRAANRTYSCAYHIAFVVDGHSECAPLVHDHRQNGARTVPVELQKRDRTDWGK
jgi:hypothetical protein